MKKLSGILVLSVLSLAAVVSESAAKEAKSAPERDKPASSSEKKSCEKESADKQKDCDKLGNGTAANACKEATKHNERNCKAAEEAGK